MHYRIKHAKKTINQHKFKRVGYNTRTFFCNVYLTRGGKCYHGAGLYLNGWVYIAIQSGYYAYKVKDIGVNKDNMAFQLLHLANPF